MRISRRRIDRKPIGQKHFGIGYLLAALIALSPGSVVAQSAGRAVDQQNVAPPDLAAAVAQYHRALEAYNKAQQAYAAETGAYWNAIAEKRHARWHKRAANEPISIDDYVLVQPPVYTGPPRPRDPLKPDEAEPRHRIYVPVVADFLTAAQREFKFVPRLPQSEGEFKRAYAAAALGAGLTRDQVLRIYSFEATGNGSYDVQAGLEYGRHGPAITTALGYNQLLATNSVEIMAESGRHMIDHLAARAAQLPDGAKATLAAKIAIVRRMIDFARSVADDWYQHEVLAGTTKGLGLHAMNLDVDVGPLLQTQKLMDSVVYARRKGFAGTLTAAELEMMNLTGDGSGFDMVTMPPAWRDKVPTANFFLRGGYRDNPVPTQ